MLVTRPRKDFHAFARLLEAQGAIPISFPTIEIRPTVQTDLLKSTLQQLHRFDWLILTSANAVKVLSDHITSGSMPPSLKLAAVGPKTANSALQLGWRVIHIPEKYVAEAILPGLGNLTGLRVLLARGDLARPELPESIRHRGGQVTELFVYRTLPASEDSEGLYEIRRGMDVLTFTSSSTVHNFVTLMRLAQMNPNDLPGSPIYAYIGPVTARTAKDYKLAIDVVADIYMLEGMIDSLCRFYSKKRVETR